MGVIAGSWPFFLWSLLLIRSFRGYIFLKQIQDCWVFFFFFGGGASSNLHRWIRMVLVCLGIFEQCLGIFQQGLASAYDHWRSFDSRWWLMCFAGRVVYEDIVALGLRTLVTRSKTEGICFVICRFVDVRVDSVCYKMEGFRRNCWVESGIRWDQYLLQVGTWGIMLKGLWGFPVLRHHLPETAAANQGYHTCWPCARHPKRDHP